MHGLGPQALKELFEDGYNGNSGWQATRSGRPDVPPIAANLSGGEEANRGVTIRTNREDVSVEQSVYDLIHIYQPSADPGSRTDKGFKEEELVESVQIDIDIADRPLADGTRSLARERMVGYTGDILDVLNDDPPYPGLLGETVYVLEGVRKGLAIWDTVSWGLLDYTIKNSNATVRLSVELEQIARNTRV
jgi:hypothetical protein